MEERIETTYAMDQSSSMFNNVCRICLQDGDLMSVYDKSIDSEFSYAEKIVQVVNSINLKKKGNLPQQICASCINDLESAYRFKMNCESTEAILQTYITPNSEGSEEIDEQELPVDDFYTYKSEIIDTEIVVPDNNDHLDKDLDDVLGKSEDNEEIISDLIDDIKPPPKAKKESTREKSTRSKRNNQSTIDKEQERIHICEICANQYKYRHALEVHMRRHNNIKPYECPECKRSFVIRFELKRHMRVHTGAKPYSCRFCERKFSDFGSRIKHERSHTGERPYICQTCGKTFAYSHVLSGHLLTHTGEKRFVCTICNKRFTKSHHLKSHMNTHLKALNKQQQQTTTIQLAQEPIKEEQELLNVVYM
ncbi:unnamed protein product [Chironomus riparius]|uniref:Uncharacterized protein n=1 Tax=Chironomus riparius TaxID=315576 RepID=A0A9P0IWJ5_9DIPT|nr:unnamed protein product [Chironomus riparius]